jgi:acetolactate synthase-1/2/3 large subunit
VVNAECVGALREFARRFGIPGGHHADGHRRLRHHDPLSMRMLGMHGAAFANYAVDDCDFLIAVGARFDDRVAGVPAKFAPNAQAHRAPRYRPRRDQQGQARALESRRPARRRPAAAARLGGARASAPTSAPGTPNWRELRTHHAMNYDRASADPALLRDRGDQPHTRGEAIIATGVGQHQMWAAQYCDFREPRLWLTSGSMGTMGFGLPAAIGAQFANPAAGHRHRWRRQHPHELGELETVTTYDLPVKVVVLNNFGDGMVKQWQKLFFKGRLSAATSPCTRRTSCARPRPTASTTRCASIARPMCRA